MIVTELLVGLAVFVFELFATGSPHMIAATPPPRPMVQDALRVAVEEIQEP